MESALRIALLDWLRADPVLAEMVHAITEEAPPQPHPPHLALVASAAADWSGKTHRGREIRVALELTDRTDGPAATARIATRIEQRIATLAAQQEGFRVVITQFLRSRTRRTGRAMRAVLLEWRFGVIEG